MRPHKTSSPFAKVRFPDHQKIKDELRALAQRVLEQETNIQAVYLFGSRASGNFSARSDADLLIVLKNDPQRPRDRIPYFLEIFQRSPVPVDVFPYTREEIQRNDFARRALQQGLLLCKRD